MGMKTIYLFRHPLFIITTLLFSFFSLWWIFDVYRGAVADGSTIIPYVYGLIALVGGVIGIVSIAPQWGGFKSILGKAIIFFSCGLLLQSLGQIVYSYFVLFLHIEIPYPSVGDIGYFGSIPMYIAAVYYLAKASGIRFGLATLKSKAIAISIPTVVVLLGYVLLLRGYEFDWANPLLIFLDFGYPFGEAIYISIAIMTLLLTKNVLGGLMKNRILFVLIALTMQFIADYMFLFLVKYELWIVGGVSDYLYLVAYASLCYAITYLSITANRLSQ